MTEQVEIDDETEALIEKMMEIGSFKTREEAVETATREYIRFHGGEEATERPAS